MGKLWLMVLGTGAFSMPVLIKNISDDSITNMIVISSPEEKAERGPFEIDSKEEFANARQVHVVRKVDCYMTEINKYKIGPTILELHLLDDGEVYYVRKDCVVM